MQKRLMSLLFISVLTCLGCGTNQIQQHHAHPDNTAISYGRFNVKAFGAKGDNKSNDAKAIQKAVDAANGAGGGTVYFPAGNYLTGTVELKSNVTLYLENGCTVWGSKDIADYHTEKTHLFWARNKTNVAIRGDGEINGNGPSFWDGGRLANWLAGKGELERTKDMIRFDECENIRLENVKINYGAFWNIGFGNCNQIAIHGISMRNGVYENDGPNTDGINLWHCQRVRISDCDIVTGDDCIVVLGKSRDVAIHNCLLQTSETAIMISGGRNIAINNCTIHDSGCGIGFRVWNGIEVDGVVISNITMDVTKKYKGGGTAIYMWSFPIYTETAVDPKQELPKPGVLRNVNISNVIASANGLVCVNGAKKGYIEGLTLDNIRLHMFGNKTCEANENPPYPYPIYGFHNASPYGMFFRYVKNLKLRDIQLTWAEPEKAEWGSALRCWHVNDLVVRSFDGLASKNSNKPVIELRSVQSASLDDISAFRKTKNVLKTDSNCSNIKIDDHHR